MASNWTLCGVCDFRNINKASVVWCSECDEGLCDECKEHHCAVKSSRNHSVISVTEYQKLPSKVLEITQTCQKHKEPFQTFCKKHDCPCCRRCVIETHNVCKDLTAIDDIVQNIKSSNAFTEMEHILVEMLGNLQKIRNNRKENAKYIQRQREKIEKEIKQSREKINDHLDKLQEKILQKLYSMESTEIEKINRLLSMIQVNEKEITDLQGSLISIKQHASELQSFLALKHIEQEVAGKQKNIIPVVIGEDMRTTYFSFVLDKEIQRITEIQNFGSVLVESYPCDISITRKKQQEAQIMVQGKTTPFIHAIDQIKTSEIINKHFEPHLGSIRGCKILSKGKMVFSSSEGTIVVLNSDGTEDFVIELKFKIFDLVYIEAENSLAVTTGNGDKYIRIIDLNTRKIKQWKNISSQAFGISLKEDTIVYCNVRRGIKEMQLTDGSETVLFKSPVSVFSYIAVHDNKLYYTNVDRYSVMCYDFQGRLQWEFKDTRRLTYPQGISLDSSGNVFVADRLTHCVYVINGDGKECRMLLSKKDGLAYPRALHFEKGSNKLLVANSNDKAFLFHIE